MAVLTRPVDPTGPPERPRTGRLRRWRRRVGTLLALVVLLLAVLWQVTADVSDAPDRVAARLTEHSATALTGELPDKITAALIATEDSRFYSHDGVDWRGFLRAPWGVLTGHDLGGSTLDQQLAKNLYENGSHGARERVAEVVLAVKLDAAYSKTDILEMYLDDAYYGHGFYGITDAANGYFGVAPDELSWAQATVLAGLFQAPSAYDPLLYPDAARVRQAHVLDRLVAVGTLSRAKANTIAAADWDLATP